MTDSQHPTEPDEQGTTPDSTADGTARHEADERPTDQGGGGGVTSDEDGNPTADDGTPVDNPA